MNDEVPLPDQRDLEALISVASHEMRGPLHALGLLFHLLERTAEAGRPAEPGMVIRGRRLIFRMTRVLDELLEVSRIWEKRLFLVLEDFDFLDVVREAIREADGSRADDLRLDLPEGPVPLFADRTRVRLLVSHLLDNAARHTQTGTPVTLSVRTDGRQVRLVVADEGPGMDAKLLCEVRHKIRPRTEFGGGLGVGLFLVQALVDHHNGFFTLEPGPQGKGLVAQVVLPRQSHGIRRQELLLPADRLT